MARILQIVQLYNRTIIQPNNYTTEQLYNYTIMQLYNSIVVRLCKVLFYACRIKIFGATVSGYEGQGLIGEVVHWEFEAP